MEILFLIGKVVINLLGAYLLLSAIYILVHAIAGHFFKQKKPTAVAAKKDAVVFIPAYKEDAVIVHVAKKALQQNYNGNFDVVVIADQLKSKTITELSKLPIELIQVNFEKSTKSKALNYAMATLNRAYDFAVILDADNVMQEGVLSKFSDYLSAGYEVVQGRRTAANLQTDFSFLDSLSEEMNNHIYNAGSNAMHCSSRIVGSGVAFDYILFRRVMSTIDVVGGFDKALELKLIQERLSIIYAPEIVTYDEKVADAEVFGNQRSRWLSAQYQFFFQNIGEGVNQLFKGNLDFVVKLYQYILPPRLLFPMICFLGAAVLALIYPFGFILWTWAFVGITAAYLSSIPKKLYTLRMFTAMGSVLSAAGQTIKALLKMNSASKTFVHTPHSGSEISNYDK